MYGLDQQLEKLQLDDFEQYLSDTDDWKRCYSPDKGTRWRHKSSPLHVNLETMKNTTKSKRGLLGIIAMDEERSTAEVLHDLMRRKDSESSGELSRDMSISMLTTNQSYHKKRLEKLQEKVAGQEMMIQIIMLVIFLLATFVAAIAISTS